MGSLLSSRSSACFDPLLFAPALLHAASFMSARAYTCPESPLSVFGVKQIPAGAEVSGQLTGGTTLDTDATFTSMGGTLPLVGCVQPGCEICTLRFALFVTKPRSPWRLDVGHRPRPTPSIETERRFRDLSITDCQGGKGPLISCATPMIAGVHLSVVAVASAGSVKLVLVLYSNGIMPAGEEICKIGLSDITLGLSETRYFAFHPEQFYFGVSVVSFPSELQQHGPSYLRAAGMRWADSSLLESFYNNVGGLADIAHHVPVVGNRRYNLGQFSFIEAPLLHTGMGRHLVDSRVLCPSSELQNLVPLWSLAELQRALPCVLRMFEISRDSLEFAVSLAVYGGATLKVGTPNINSIQFDTNTYVKYVEGANDYLQFWSNGFRVPLALVLERLVDFSCKDAIDMEIVATPATTDPKRLHGTWTYPSSGTVNSDRRLKTEITPLRRQLRPVSYSFKAGSESKYMRFGFIADELETTVPQLVRSGGLENAKKDLIALLTAAGQSQQEVIENQERLMAGLSVWDQVESEFEAFKAELKLLKELKEKKRQANRALACGATRKKRSVISDIRRLPCSGDYAASPKADDSQFNDTLSTSCGRRRLISVFLRKISEASKGRMESWDGYVWPVSWPFSLARVFGTPLKEGRIGQLGQMMFVTVLGLAVGVLLWGRSADHPLEDQRTGSATNQQQAASIGGTQDPAEQAFADPQEWRNSVQGEDDLFFGILDAYTNVRTPETPQTLAEVAGALGSLALEAVDNQTLYQACISAKDAAFGKANALTSTTTSTTTTTGAPTTTTIHADLAACKSQELDASRSAKLATCELYDDMNYINAGWEYRLPDFQRRVHNPVQQRSTHHDSSSHGYTSWEMMRAARAARCGDAAAFTGTYEEYLERDIQTLAVLQARSKNCSAATTGYDSKVTECAKAFDELTSKLQAAGPTTAVTQEFCSAPWAAKVAACSNYDACYTSKAVMQESSFNAAKELANSRQATAIRAIKAEYLALKRIDCLLNVAWLHLVLESSAAEQPDKLTACVSAAHDVSSLELKKPVPPAKASCALPSAIELAISR
ncbi:hypothetical protein AK812_SmicGene24293 [Symbiodinium microadriaticum]|uniref:Peptidase S74 domain-containing protein n=1 Tax=Symbiodinium microadriaticum TaxID=2951 RepID=A0A1Q9DF37_SYMMI|nr:hypothetical protein AK812_SmicGene24293 [Symbiodinium microadriaticum]